MMRLSCSNLKKAYGVQALFSHASFTVYSRDKIGFVGANGAGKTTLFRLLTGRERPDEGEISKAKETRIGMVEQYTQTEENRGLTVWEELMTVFAEVTETEEALVRLEEEISAGGDAGPLVERQFALRQRLEELGGLTCRSRARAALLGLGFTKSDLSLPFSALSGGQQTKVMLCKLLLSGANLLLLDEPTNHLDMDATRWLEGFLQSYEGSFIVISHDRYFLDRVTNQTFELEWGRLTVYKGNYTAYRAQKEERAAAVRKKYELTQKEIHRLEGIVAQQRQWNREKNIKTAESKLKAIARLEEGLVEPDRELKTMRFAFPVQRPGAKEVLLAQDLSMGFGGSPLFSHVDFTIYKGDRIFLLGPNGCGKTTLLKTLLGQYTPLAGRCRLGVNIDVGYYDQAQTGLNGRFTVLEEVRNAYPKMSETELRGALAAFLFRGDDVFKPISALSGGERARVLLLKLMLSGANLLLLDEPTNHLDIASREALEQALEGYEGALFVVSHDRYFINRLAQRILVLEKGGLSRLDGNYDTYLQKTAAPEQAAPKAKGGSLSYQERKEKQAAIRRLQARVSRAQEEIHRLEGEISRAEQTLFDPKIASDYEKALALTQELDALKAALDGQYAAWEQAEQALSRETG